MSLLLPTGTTPLIRRTFNILAEESTAVVDYLAPRESYGARSNRVGTAILYLAISRGFLFRHTKGKFFGELTGK